MYIRVVDDVILAYSDHAFNGYTDELPLIDYDDYAKNPNKYIYEGGTIVKNPLWEEEQAKAREKDFNSQFFNIENYGYFRKTPKGYGSAIEAMNTAFNTVTILGNLPANTLTFYKQPNFEIEKQCTEEWLVENSYKNETMTPEEFGKFYAEFITAWNYKEHL